MSSLYELNAKLATYEMEYDEDGVWINEDELDAIHMERDEKIENVCLWAKNLRAEASAIKTEEKALSDRRKSKERKADSLEAYVASNLDGQKFETPRVKIQWRKSEAVEILDESKVPSEYMDISVVSKPIKAEIKKYLKGIEGSGETCDWARLDKRNSMSIK